MSGFVGLHTALTGIRAGQRGLDTASHNVANANTPGYTRQRTVQQSRFPWRSESGPIGTGVGVARVERLREALLDTRVRSIGASFAATDTTAALLQRAEDVLGEPEHGISPLLGELFDAFEDLALTPADGAARQQVVASLDALAARFGSVTAGWGQLSADTTQRIDLAVTDVNTRLERISEINRTLAGFGSEQRPNDLLDDRDALIDGLARMIGATATTTAKGMVELHLDGQVLVSVGPPSSFQQVQYAGGVSVVGPPAVGVTAHGELGALHEFVSTTLPAVQADLDALAADVAVTLSAQHQGVLPRLRSGAGRAGATRSRARVGGGRHRVLPRHARRVDADGVPQPARPLRGERPHPSWSTGRPVGLGSPTAGGGVARSSTRGRPRSPGVVLVLTRRIGESIVIGDDIVVTVLDVRSDQVRLGIEAPRSVQVHREGVFRQVASENTAAVASAHAVTELLGRRSTQPRRPPQR